MLTADIPDAMKRLVAHLGDMMCYRCLYSIIDNPILFIFTFVVVYVSDAANSSENVLWNCVIENITIISKTEADEDHIVNVVIRDGIIELVTTDPFKERVISLSMMQKKTSLLVI